MPKPKKPATGKRGRPSMYSEELAAEICERIASGKSLRKVCEADDMPSISAVTKWLNSKPDFVAQYARARDGQADTYAGEIVEIADTEPDPNKARVRIDARKWVAARLAPKKYGDKIAHTGGDEGDNPIRAVLIDAIGAKG